MFQNLKHLSGLPYIILNNVVFFEDFEVITLPRHDKLAKQMILLRNVLVNINNACVPSILPYTKVLSVYQEFHVHPETADIDNQHTYFRQS